MFESSDFHDILIITTSKNEALRIYNETIKNVKIEFANYDENEIVEDIEESSFEMYLEGDAVEHSNSVNLLEMEIDKDKYINQLKQEIEELKDLTKRFKLKDYSLKQHNLDIVDTVYADVIVAYDYPEDITDDMDKYLAYVGENLEVTKFNYVISCNITDFVNNHKDIYIKAFNWNKEYEEEVFVCSIFEQTLTGNASDRFYRTFMDLVNVKSLDKELENDEIDITE